MHTATLQTFNRLSALAKARRDSAHRAAGPHASTRDSRRDSIPTAQALVAEAARRHGLDWRDCTPAERLVLLHEVRLLARAWLRREGERLAAVLYPDEADGKTASKGLFGKAKDAANRFFDRAGAFIRNAVVAGTLAFFGPHESTRIEAEAIDRAVGVQMEYLANFRNEVLTEDKQFVPARAELYGGSVWPAAYDVVRTVIHEGGVFNFERRVHIGPEPSPGAYDPCTVCNSERDKGIVPIGTLKPIGASPCTVNCHCRFGWYVTEDGDEFVAGDPDVYARVAGTGPFHEPAFGRRSWGSDSANLVTKFNPHHDADGRFASGSGGGASRTGEARRARIADEGRSSAPSHAQHRRKRKPRGKEHRERIAIHKRERRELAHDIKRQRRQLDRQHRSQRREVERDASREARKLDRRQTAERTHQSERHTHEAAHSQSPKATERRHADERQDLADRHAGERRDLAQSIRSERRDLREQHADERHELRNDARAEAASQRRSHRAEEAEELSGHHQERVEAHETRHGHSKAWTTDGIWASDEGDERILSAKSDYSEAQHPRDDHGQWTSGGGGGHAGHKPSAGGRQQTSRRKPRKRRQGRKPRGHRRTGAGASSKPKPTGGAAKPTKPRVGGGQKPAASAKPRHQRSRYHTPEHGPGINHDVAEQLAATKTEHKIARALGGRQVGDFDPLRGKRKPEYDVHLNKAQSRTGRDEFVEVKYKHEGAKNAISAHADALLRKADHQAEAKGSGFHTVLVDVRDRSYGGTQAQHYRGHDLYYRRGCGAYSTANMYRVKDQAELQRLVRMKDHELPEKARGTMPVRSRKLEAQAAKVADSRKSRDSGGKKAARRARYLERKKAGVLGTAVAIGA